MIADHKLTLIEHPLRIETSSQVDGGSFAIDRNFF